MTHSNNQCLKNSPGYTESEKYVECRGSLTGPLYFNFNNSVFPSAARN